MVLNILRNVPINLILNSPKIVYYIGAAMINQAINLHRAVQSSLKKLSFAQIVKEISTFHEILWFIAVTTNTSH
jgi:hypothetical protein